MNIAVIGAGIAGLSAARALVDRGHTVKVFERGRVAGGRVATRVIQAIELPRGLSGDVAFDYGAQYFTVRDDRFSALAAEWERDKVLAKWAGRIVSFDGEGWEDVEDTTSRYVGTPGMSAIADALARGLDIEYGSKVEALAPLLNDFDRVIVATPPDQAAALGVTVPVVTMMPNWTVMAAFEDRVAARFDAAFVNGSPLGWIARNTSKPKRNWKIDCWVLQATSAWSRAHSADRSDDVGSFLMEAFDDLIPAGLPKAFFASVHRWKSATADPPLAAGAIQNDRITLCGDWCKGSRIEDAYLSGIEAATLL
ncbi:MAG: FAD-dependent oxidoreductase [Cyanobacteria bacterium]|nr:FAD-dependent oxidoreductase [Cyanobacteriota bacterium]